MRRVGVPRLVALVVLLGVGGTGQAAVRREPPVMVSAAAPSRQALIVAPADSRATADADAYRDLLRRLGFKVETLAADSRVDLDAELRHYAVRPDAEVLVLVLGATLARDRDLFVTAASPAPDVVARPALYAAEGVRLADVLGHVAAREVAVIVDACRAADAEGCVRAAAGMPDGISMIVAYKTNSSSTTGAPVAGIASLRDDLIPLMREPGLSLLDLFGRLRDRLKGTDMALAATPSLSRNFVLLPADFLERLPSPCNVVRRGEDAATLRNRDLGRLAAECASAARVWDFSSHFDDKLRIVREQAGALGALAGCRPRDAAEAYLRDYPNGDYRAEVERFGTRCDDEARAAAASPPPVEAPVEAPSPRARRIELIPRGDQSPSFSCAGQLGEPVARLICADAELAAADYGLGVAYRVAVRGLDPSTRRAAMTDQRAWLGRRNATCGIPLAGDWSLDDLAPFKPCLLAEIEKRARELGQ